MTRLTLLSALFVLALAATPAAQIADNTGATAPSARAIPSAPAAPTDGAQPGTELQYYRAPGKEGLDVFEAPKDAGAAFRGLSVQVGGDFAIQFQGLSQSNDADTVLVDLVPNFVLPTANLNLDVQIASGMRMHLRT